MEETQAEDTVRRKMESLRLICDGQIPIQQQRMDSDIVVSETWNISGSQRGKLTSHVFLCCLIKDEGFKTRRKLRLAEDDMVKALAVRTRQEVKRMAKMDAIAAQKARVEELRRSVQEQRADRDQYAAIVSQQSLALAAFEDRCNKEVECKAETPAATSWYNRVLGFHVEGGHGVKFTFKNINPLNSNEKYSFTIRYAYDTYTCRMMGEKFQEAVAQGFLPQSTTHHQESSMISMSALVLSVSTDRSDSNDHHVQHGQGNRPKKVLHARVMKPDVSSPGSAASVRRSPCLKVNK